MRTEYNRCTDMRTEYNNMELSEIFYTTQKKCFRVKLNPLGLFLQRDDTDAYKTTLKISDIIGGRCMRLQKRSQPLLGSSCTCGSTRSLIMNADTVSKNDPTFNNEDQESSAYLYVFAYILKKNIRNTLRRERKVLTLRFRSFDNFELNMKEAERWYTTLKWYKNQTLDRLISPDIASVRRLLIILNPKSGSGKARELFHAQISPILNEAEIAYDLHVTKYPNYARDIVCQGNLSTWNAIVAVGGDGLFFEILNGILKREDRERILDQITLGIVPCGSGNGLAKSIAHAYREPYDPKPILGAALTIVHGKTSSMDVVRVQLRNEVIYSFLSVGWGLISDIDIESERLRSLGYQRFTIWTLYRLISLRTYRGKVAYLLKCDIAPKSEIKTTPLQNLTLTHSMSCNADLNVEKGGDLNFQSREHLGDNNEFDDVISLETSANQSFRSRCDSWFSAGSRKSTYYSISESIYHSIASNSEYDPNDEGRAHDITEALDLKMLKQHVNLNHVIPDSWIVEEGEFVMVHAAYQTHLGIDCFFAPSAKLNDGAIYLVMIRGGISRSKLLNFMVNMSSGTHIPSSSEYIKVAVVTAFRIEPYDDHGIVTVDGERVQYGPIQGEILPGIANIVVPK